MFENLDASTASSPRVDLTQPLFEPSPHAQADRPIPVRTIATPLPPVSPRLIQRRSRA